MNVPREWTTSGERTRIDVQDRDVPAYDPRSGAHLWIWTVAYRAYPERLGDPDYTPMLDQETMLTGPALGCYFCEQPYQPRMLHRRCPGEPR